jgi:hypothetical protein
MYSCLKLFILDVYAEIFDKKFITFLFLCVPPSKVFVLWTNMTIDHGDSSPNK